MRRVALFVIALAGCGTDQPSAAAHRAALEDESPVEVCRRLFAREHECRAEFIPALVDLRLKLDLPAGIAARARSQGRAALIALARAEYAVDGVEPQRSETCKRVAPSVPAAQLAAVRPCLQRPDCPAFVSCVMPMHEALFRARR